MIRSDSPSRDGRMFLYFARKAEEHQTVLSVNVETLFIILVTQQKHGYVLKSITPIRYVMSCENCSKHPETMSMVRVNNFFEPSSFCFCNSLLDEWVMKIYIKDIQATGQNNYLPSSIPVLDMTPTFWHAKVEVQTVCRIPPNSSLRLTVCTTKIWNYFSTDKEVQKICVKIQGCYFILCFRSSWGARALLIFPLQLYASNTKRDCRGIVPQASDSGHKTVRVYRSVEATEQALPKYIVASRAEYESQCHRDFLIDPVTMRKEHTVLTRQLLYTVSLTETSLTVQ